MYAGGITAFFDEDYKLRAIIYKDEETQNPELSTTEEPDYCAYGSAEECYTMWNHCGEDDTCDELEEKGEYFKKDYENFLKKYDLTIDDLKEYLEYEYLKERAIYD